MIDGQMVITESFNFTKAAEDNNAENLLVIQHADMAAKYAQNGPTRRRCCLRLSGRSSGGSTW